MNPIRIRSRQDSGQSLVEFALVLPMLMLVVVGMCELGKATFAKSMVTEAARRGARAAIVDGTGEWKATAEQAASDVLFPNGVGEKMFQGTKIDATCTDEPPYQVTVHVSVPIMHVWIGHPDSVMAEAVSVMDCQPAFVFKKPELP